jgi:hypothetical protein
LDSSLWVDGAQYSRHTLYGIVLGAPYFELGAPFEKRKTTTNMEVLWDADADIIDIAMTLFSARGDCLLAFSMSSCWWIHDDPVETMLRTQRETTTMTTKK